MRSSVQGEILLVLLAFKQAWTDYSVKRPTTQWDYQNPPCQLASPEILHSSDGPTVNIPSNIEIPLNERVFVGYTRAFEVFEYTGCIWNGDLPNNIQTYSIQSDPGQCYSACRTKHFGIRNGHCYCLTHALKDVKDTYTGCGSQCSFPRYTSCGGTGLIYNYISVYKRVEIEEKGMDDGKYCRIYDQGRHSYLWQRCDAKLKGVCQTASRDNLFLNSEHLYWYRYPQTCFDQDYYPVSDLPFKINRNIAVWIGRMKSWTIVNVSAAQPEDVTHGYYGYISNQNNKLRLQFTKEQSGSVLCISEPETTSTTTTTTTTATTTTVTTTTTATTTLTSTVASPPTTMTSSTSATTKPPGSTETSVTTTQGSTSTVFQNHTYEGELGHRDRNTDYGLIAVYVPIPLVLLMGVAVAIFVFRWKRKRKRGEVGNKVLYTNGIPANTKPTHRNGTTVTNVTYDNISNLDHDNKSPAVRATRPRKHDDGNITNTMDATYSNTNARDDGENKKHEYFILEPSYENLGIPKADQGDMDDGTYDTTNGVSTADTEVNGNIYNKLSVLTDDTYSHINKGSMNNATGLTISGHVINDDSYYSITGCSDSMYDTSAGGMRTANRSPEVDDTYNHI